MPGFPVRCSIPLSALALLAGISFVQLLPALPEPWWALLSLPLALAVRSPSSGTPGFLAFTPR